MAMLDEEVGSKRKLRDKTLETATFSLFSSFSSKKQKKNQLLLNNYF